jgi:hypothetical protein
MFAGCIRGHQNNHFDRLLIIVHNGLLGSHSCCSTSPLSSPLSR